MGKMLVAALIALAGIFSIFCSVKDYDWFMEHRKAKAISAIIGRNATRGFYITLGIALVVVGIVVMLKNFEAIGAL